MSSQPASQAKWSPDTYYGEARKAQASGEHETAIKYFSELEIHYPFSPYAQLAPIEIGYGYYKLKNYDATVREVERFINTHPDHANTDYAYYLKGLASSDQALKKESTETEVAETIDTEKARQAFNSFSAVVQNYPDSKYRNNAIQHMNKLRNQLARHELKFVREQLAQGDKQAALKLAKYITEQYPKTAAAAEALEIVTKASSTTISPIIANQTIPAQAISQPIKHQQANNKTPSEAWLLQQNPTHFTLQLIGTSNQQKLENYIIKHQLQDKSAYFKRKLNNKDWYSLLYGNYSQRAAATTSANQLKQSLGLKQIWIRQFKDVQASIEQSQSGVTPP